MDSGCGVLSITCVFVIDSLLLVTSTWPAGGDVYDYSQRQSSKSGLRSRRLLAGVIQE